MTCLQKTVPNLQLSWPLVEVEVGKPVLEWGNVEYKRLTFLIDTWASHSNIDADIAANLGLIVRDTISVSTPSGTSQMYRFDASMRLTGMGHAVPFDIELTGARLSNQGIAWLIGRDILQNFTVIYNGWANNFQVHV